MTIVLRDLRTAVQNYLDTKVTVSISALTPAGGTTIQPNETFTFSVTGTNTAAPDAIRLVNVRYHVKVVNPTVAKLVVPASNPDASGIKYKSGSGGLFTVDLSPNAEVSEMYLFPPVDSGFPFPSDKAGDLDPGDSDTITGLKGKAAPALGGGITQITCRILADPDLDFLFPQNEDNPSATKALTVIG